MKIIYVLPWSSLVTGKEFKVDLFADGFHVWMAEHVWQRTKRYQLECWRPECKLRETISSEKDGITYRAFPSFRPTLGFLNRYVYKAVMATAPQIRYALLREYSWPMLRELKKQSKQEEVLINLYGFGDLGYLICLCKPNVPIVGAHLGAAPYTSSASSLLYHLPMSLFERKALSRVNRLIEGTRWYYDFFSKWHHNVAFFQPVGTDFELFQPIPKKKARSILGIPLNKRVLLHVGRFDSAKGVDAIINIYQQLRSRYDLELILIGGLKTDPLYRKAVESGAIVRERMPQHELIPYYSAADLYLFTRFYSNPREEKLEEFMGFGAAPIESLACGTPIVGTNLRHFLGTKEELRKIGKMPKDIEDAVKCVSEILEHPELYQNCRQIAWKYYSWENVVDRLIAIYDELFDEYYK